jgi:hypothetical protein
MLMASWKNYDKGAFGMTRFLREPETTLDQALG